MPGIYTICQGQKKGKRKELKFQVLLDLNSRAEQLQWKVTNKRAEDTFGRLELLHVPGTLL